MGEVRARQRIGRKPEPDIGKLDAQRFKNAFYLADNVLAAQVGFLTLLFSAS
ncbi:hypothetical protein M728_005568 (plasmid) [Ensifer sp. WSM1721]